MTDDYDLLVRNTYLADRDAVVDVGVRGDAIVRVADAIDAGAPRTIDAGGDLVAPAFVDAHLHVDKAYSARGAGRRPAHNERGLDLASLRETGLAHYRERSREQLADDAVRVCERAAEHGTGYVRAHVNLGNGIRTKVVESMLDARERLEGVVDVELVLFPDAGILNDENAEGLLRESLEMGADLVGGADPAVKNGDVEGTLAAWFDVATDHDAGIDVHLHSGGTLSLYELLRLAAHTDARDYGGRVTASHAFGLADAGGSFDERSVPDFHDAGLKGLGVDSVAAVIEVLAGAGVSVTSSYTNARPGMPIRKLLERGVPLGWGSDNVRDYVVGHGRPDPLLGQYVNACKLDYNYHTFASNPGLARLWEMITRGGARVLGVEDEYGIAEGKRANLVVLDARSPQWAILDRARRRYVIHDGRVIVEDGDILDREARER